MKLGCENGEIYWQSTTTDGYSYTGFNTGYELKPDTKYFISFDVKNPYGAFKYAGFYASPDSSKCDVWWDFTQSNLPHASFTDFGSSEWTTKNYVLDTASVDNLVTATNKYLSFGAKIDWTAGTTLAFKNLTITEIDDNTILPTAVDRMKIDVENGEIYWQSTTTEQYSFTGFKTGYELKPDTKYFISFDVKNPYGAFKYAGFYASPDSSKCDVPSDLIASKLPYVAFTDFGGSEWTTKNYILDTASVENFVTDTNKYLSFGAAIDWSNGTTLAFKNLTVQELDDTSLTLNNFGGFQTFIEDGKLVSKYNRTSGTDEYSLLGFATSFKVEAGKKYVVAFDFEKEFENGFNEALSLTTFSDSHSSTPSSTRVVFNGGESSVWSEKTVIFSTDDTEKTYLGVVAKTWPSNNYIMSFKNFNVYDLGDVNFDGSIGSDDLICLRKELLGVENTGARFTNINADEAGETNIIDLVALKKLLAANSTNS